jgi:drug/metabolite transporter (DMT)-like permease
MSNTNLFKGVVFVGLGASSYGMLATFVKLAYTEQYTTAEVTVSQFIYGIIGMLLINAYTKSKAKGLVEKATSKNILQLLLAGTSMGLTSVFYYVSVRYISVSIAIILLMQSVWMGVLAEWILTKKTPSIQKLISVLIVLTGTILATNSLNQNTTIDWNGIGWGLMAAASFTTTLFTANRVAVGISSVQRSLYMLIGGAVIVFGFALLTQNTPFNFSIFLKWGIFLALFGTIIPPILMNAGFPITGIGLGSIISALELPVSVMMAYIILNERIAVIQWIGIALILFAIFLMNIHSKKV